MSPQEKYAAKYPDNEGESKSLDQNTLSIISVVSQATVVNLSRPDSLPPHINTSKSTSCSGNSFGGRDEAKRQKQATDNHPSELTANGVDYKISAFRNISSKITTIAISSTINKALSGQFIFGTCELDSKADTCCIGANFLPIYYTNRVVNVIPYNNDENAQVSVRVVSGATSYTCQHTGETYILWIHEGLYFGEGLPGHSLVSPNQLRHNGTQVQDNPYNTKNPMSIQGDDANENKFLFHYYQKVLIYFLTLAHLLILKFTHVLMFILLTNENGTQANLNFLGVL